MLGRGVAALNPELQNAFNSIKNQLLAADITLANLESPVTSAPLVINHISDMGIGRLKLTNVDLRAQPTSLIALTSADIDLVSLANNHINDCGSQGIYDTHTALRNFGILPIGPEPIITYQEIHGVRLAFLAYDSIKQQYEFGEFLHEVEEAVNKGAVTIVSVHWGYEYQSMPNLRQRELAQSLADSGAALVWGHHPHVLQPVEWIYSQKTRRKTLVIYSLGNALFDQYQHPDAQLSAGISLSINSNGIHSLQGFPFIIHVWHGDVGFADNTTSLRIYDRLGITYIP